jgi:hypothetical protein
MGVLLRLNLAELEAAMSLDLMNKKNRRLFTSYLFWPWRGIRQVRVKRAPALKAAIEDLKAGRLENGWDKLEAHGVIKEVTAGEALRRRAVDEHLEALRAGKTSLMIAPRHD